MIVRHYVEHGALRTAIKRPFPAWGLVGHTYDYCERVGRALRDRRRRDILARWHAARAAQSALCLLIDAAAQDPLALACPV